MPADSGHRPDAVPIVIVGAGPTGVRVAQELRRRLPGRPLKILGAEPHEPYDRVQLSSALAGEVQWRTLMQTTQLPVAADIQRLLGTEVRAIDRAHRCVRERTGLAHPYSALVLALGSRPHLPNVPGIELAGVYTFRSLRDAEALSARRVRSRHTVILGGGLLGLEAARAMRRFQTGITVVEHADRLMPRQLDADGAALLKRSIEGLGIRVIVGDGVTAILGAERVAGVQLRSGERIDCDTVVVATGIVPNTQIALDAGLPIGRGIRVDDAMRTADPDIYAVGECAEHRGIVYGLVAPCFEQAAVAAAAIAGDHSCYAGSLAATRLKVLQIPVFSAGLRGEDAPKGALRELSHRDSAGHYRKLVLRGSRLVGALAVGDWPELPRVLEAVHGQRRIGWSLRRRFRRDGCLWNEAQRIASWPDAAVVCNCTSTSCGALRSAIAGGCNSVDALAAQTRASSVCGSCKPLLAELLNPGEVHRAIAVPGARSLLAMALSAALIAAAVTLLPNLPYIHSWQQHRWHWDQLWRELLLKQVSGFSLLGLSLIGLLLSLRKRIAGLDFGAFWLWRSLHVGIGLAATALLFAHTGGRFGHGLNAWLMAVFVALTAAGAAAAMLTAVEHRLAPATAKRQRRRLTWLHILAFWPLPLLLGFHVLKIYYF